MAQIQSNASVDVFWLPGRRTSPAMVSISRPRKISIVQGPSVFSGIPSSEVQAFQQGSECSKRNLVVPVEVNHPGSAAPCPLPGPQASTLCRLCSAGMACAHVGRDIFTQESTIPRIPDVTHRPLWRVWGPFPLQGRSGLLLWAWEGLAGCVGT